MSTMKAPWYEGKELAIALAVGGGMLSAWWYESLLWTIVAVPVFAVVGWLLQKGR